MFLRGQLTQLKPDLPNTANDLTQTFTYNTAGQIASMARSNDAYVYDQQVNVERSYTNNGLNQTTASGTDAINWDARGNLASWAGQAYTFNADNLLLTAPGSVSLSYDPMARLKQVVQGSVTTKFGYSGLDLIGEYNASGSLLRRYVHGPGMDNPIVWYEGTGTSDRRFLLGDERGSIRE